MGKGKIIAHFETFSTGVRPARKLPGYATILAWRDIHAVFDYMTTSRPLVLYILGCCRGREILWKARSAAWFCLWVTDSFWIYLNTLKSSDELWLRKKGRSYCLDLLTPQYEDNAQLPFVINFVTVIRL